MYKRLQIKQFAVFQKIFPNASKEVHSTSASGAAGGTWRIDTPVGPTQSTCVNVTVHPNAVSKKLGVKYELGDTRNGMSFGAKFPHRNYFSPLKTWRRRLYLKTQFVPRSKHFSSLL